MKIIALLFCYIVIPFQSRLPVRGEYQYIEVQHQRQGYNLCVPTSASMVLHYYGDTISPARLKQLTTPEASTFEGTYLGDLVAAVKILGYNWEVRDFPYTAAGFKKGFAEIRLALDEGHPVLVSTSLAPIGHTMVMVGYDAKQKVVFIVDPNREAPGKRTLGYNEFRKIWHEDIAQARAFVLTRPK